MKAFYQPLMVIALGVLTAYTLLEPDKKVSEQTASATHEASPQSSTENEEVVFRCKKEPAQIKDESKKLELVPLKTNE